MKCDERHEGTGTGLDLSIEDIIAEAVSICEPPEPYFEFHRGKGTGTDLKAGQVLSDADAILEAAWASLTPVVAAEAVTI